MRNSVASLCPWRASRRLLVTGSVIHYDVMRHSGVIDDDERHVHRSFRGEDCVFVTPDRRRWSLRPQRRVQFRPSVDHDGKPCCKNVTEVGGFPLNSFKDEPVTRGCAAAETQQHLQSVFGSWLKSSTLSSPPVGACERVRSAEEIAAVQQARMQRLAWLQQDAREEENLHERRVGFTEREGTVIDRDECGGWIAMRCRNRSDLDNLACPRKLSFRHYDVSGVTLQMGEFVRFSVQASLPQSGVASEADMRAVKIARHPAPLKFPRALLHEASLTGRVTTVTATGCVIRAELGVAVYDIPYCGRLGARLVAGSRVAFQAVRSPIHADLMEATNIRSVFDSSARRRATNQPAPSRQRSPEE